MSLPIERLGTLMPQYPNAKLDRFQIEAKPIIFFRRWIPYFVGNNVTFRVRIKDTTQTIDSTILYIVESFGDDTQLIKKIQRADLPNDWIELTGNPIDRECDVMYRVATSPKGDNAHTFLSAHVVNTDRWALGCVGLLAGFIVAIASGIVLGFIKVEPILRMFIEP
jgi:hypothetical protein